MLAGLSTETATARILIANFKDEVAITELAIANLPWKDGARIEKAVVDREHNLEVIRTEWLHGPDAILKEVIPSATTVLYTLTKK